ncbi:subunit 17 of mediator complex-domain-containing protein [Truncatella angustata]|uniref:Mediator of RNA polymerase II transcription subunit 17 n=1 Tax=Truncatella angustata TaxID=152316 RepID=A0A9P8ZTV3_9PEZI|nr:subunit 17 of mediator complex-domain-containing protein [Truncatella angustata]KAH6648771.1 subunit 17 of mediator complex-domain-containing protein [Truncatella angustata]
MASISASPFSLRPWPTGDKKPKSLGEFITRVNAERGGFRNVTEAELREEVQAKDEGRMDGSNSSPDGEADSDDDAADGEKPKTIIEAREEFLRNIEFAHQSAMLSLDFISLLLSKEMPNQANMTLSPALRDLVGFGVLGASRLHESNLTPARIQDDLTVATGWRLMGTNKMVDSVLEAAERLEKEISLETKYWADVLAVSDNGWTVASLPYEPHSLGVRYGFAESAPEYRNSSIAPLRRNDDGTVRIERGLANGGSKRVRAVVERDGLIIGKSHLPGRVPDDAPLQDRVLEARNTILSQELWFEINREARTLLSLNIQPIDDRIIYHVDADTKVVLTVEDLDKADAGGESHDDQMANTIVLGLHFLLLFSHRLNYFKRTQSTQTNTSRNNAPLSILRPLISRLTFDNACSKLTYFLTGLKTILQNAGLPSVDFAQSTIPPVPQLAPAQISQLALQQIWRASPSEALMINMAQLLELTVELTITPQARIALRGRSFVTPLATTQFMVKLLEPLNTNPATQGQSQAQEQSQQVPNPLEDAYPPFMTDSYPNVDEALYYIRQASIRAVTDWTTDFVADKLDRDDINWSETPTGPLITARGGKDLKIEITDSPVLALTLHMQWVEGKSLKVRKLAWTAGEEVPEKLEEVVLEFFR